MTISEVFNGYIAKLLCFALDLHAEIIKLLGTVLSIWRLKTCDVERCYLEFVENLYFFLNKFEKIQNFIMVISLINLNLYIYYLKLIYHNLVNNL